MKATVQPEIEPDQNDMPTLKVDAYEVRGLEAGTPARRRTGPDFVCGSQDARTLTPNGDALDVRELRQIRVGLGDLQPGIVGEPGVALPPRGVARIVRVAPRGESN